MIRASGILAGCGMVPYQASHLWLCLAAFYLGTPTLRDKATWSLCEVTDLQVQQPVSKQTCSPLAAILQSCSIHGALCGKVPVPKGSKYHHSAYLEPKSGHGDPFQSHTTELVRACVAGFQDQLANCTARKGCVRDNKIFSTVLVMICLKYSPDHITVRVQEHMPPV